MIAWLTRLFARKSSEHSSPTRVQRLAIAVKAINDAERDFFDTDAYPPNSEAKRVYLEFWLNHVHDICSKRKGN